MRLHLFYFNVLTSSLIYIFLIFYFYAYKEELQPNNFPPGIKYSESESKSHLSRSAQSLSFSLLCLAPEGADVLFLLEVIADDRPQKSLIVDWGIIQFSENSNGLSDRYYSKSFKVITVRS